MASYPSITTTAVAVPFNMALDDLEHAEVDSNYHSVQEALLELEQGFDDDEIVRIICAAAILLQKDWEVHDALGTAIVWERG